MHYQTQQPITVMKERQYDGDGQSGLDVDTRGSQLYVWPVMGSTAGHKPRPIHQAVTPTPLLWASQPAWLKSIWWHRDPPLESLFLKSHDPDFHGNEWVRSYKLLPTFKHYQRGNSMNGLHIESLNRESKQVISSTSQHLNHPLTRLLT